MGISPKYFVSFLMQVTWENDVAAFSNLDATVIDPEDAVHYTHQHLLVLTNWLTFIKIIVVYFLADHNFFEMSNANK